MDDGIIKNITKEIIRECTHKGMEVSEAFISYYVRLLVLDPSWELISENNLVERSALQKLIKFCVTRLQYEKCPCMMTLRMQKYFTCNFELQEEHAALHQRATLREKLTPLENEILECDSNSSEDLTRLYRKIIFFITLLSGLGNPATPTVYKEAYVALQSIFNINDLDDFINTPKEYKEQFLYELTNLVAGIRLFNRDCKKGGRGIEDLPKIMLTALEVTNKELQQSLIVIMDYINTFTTAIDKCFSCDSKSDGYYLACELPEGVEEEDLEYIKDMLVFHRQYEIYVRRFMEEIVKIEEHFDGLLTAFYQTMSKIHEICKNRTAIPISIIFPPFTELASVWKKIQDEIIYLANLNHILINIQLMYKDMDLKKNLVELMLGDSEPITDAERLEITPELSVQMMKFRQILLDPNTFKDFNKIPLQYLGFCAWKFVEMHGALIPGNPNMGVARIRNKYFVFSTLEAAEEFARDPNRYIREGIEILRKKPELINLLQMYDQVETAKNVKDIVFKSRDLLVIHNVDVQTDLHSPPNIDPTYMWNVWDYKRQALILANVSRCKTKSTETDQVGSKVSVRTQTYELRDKHLQTKKDNYSNVPTLLNFIYGLRGRKDDKQFVWTLTRPVQE